MNVLYALSNLRKKLIWDLALRSVNSPLLVTPNANSLIRDLPGSTFHSDQSNSDLLRMVTEQYLTESGFLESVLTRRPQRNGLPIPWFTFSAVDFISSLDLGGKRILEIGSGFSTLYWAKSGLVGISLECDEAWYELIKSSLNEGFLNAIELVKIVGSDELPVHSIRESLDKTWLTKLNQRIGNEFKEETEEFFASKQNLLPSLTRYLPEAELVIIDGVARNICLMLAAELSPQSALIILDNSDRLEYATGQEFLTSRGWKAMRFKGLGPLNPYEWETTIFSR